MLTKSEVQNQIIHRQTKWQAKFVFSERVSQKSQLISGFTNTGSEKVINVLTKTRLDKE